MRSRILPLFLALAAFASSSAMAGQTMYAIGDGGASLLRFDGANPGSVTKVADFSGASTFLDGLDFRPSNGLLYGYLDNGDSIYTVDVNTGALSFVSTSSVPTNTFILGIDFNPTADRLRIVTDSQQNLRVNVDTGATINDGALTYDPNDINGNALATRIADAAYTNSNSLFSGTTKLYYIDYELDTLVTTVAPNAGTLTTVGALGVDTNEIVGFDIFTDNNGLNSAFATLTVGGVTSLYTISLTTGAATLVGDLSSDFGNIYGLAIAPAAVVPEPSTIAMGVVGIGGLALLARRRRV